jgi:ATP-dependent helicase/nuclease subunit A
MDSKSRHFLSERWQREFGKKVRGVNTEALCTLYVAMTRARRALYMLMQPSNKIDFNNKCAASLVYHSLRCDQDPTVADSALFELGDQHWYRSAGESVPVAGQGKTEVSPLQIQFQPLPPVPRRNRN